MGGLTVWHTNFVIYIINSTALDEYIHAKNQHAKIQLLPALYNGMWTEHPSFQAVTLLQQQSFGRFFSVQWNSELSAHLVQLAAACRDTAWPWGHGRARWPWDTSEQSLTSNRETSHSYTHRPHLANGAKAAFLLHKSFTSFKYCDNWSALVVTIQVQEPGLASIMNTVCLSHLLPTRLNQHPSSKNKNNLMKIGKCAPDIKLFRWGLLSLQC